MGNKGCYLIKFNNDNNCDLREREVVVVVLVVVVVIIINRQRKARPTGPYIIMDDIRSF